VPNSRRGSDRPAFVFDRISPVLLTYPALDPPIETQVIHAHQFGAHGLYALFAGKAPIVVSAWGSDVLVNPNKSLLLKWLVRFLARHADLMTADSQEVTLALIRLGAKPERILTFPFGLRRENYEYLSRVIRPELPLVLCAPRLHEPLYNPEVILEAFRRITDFYPQVELWFLGDGSLTPKLKQQALQLNLTRVRYWGRVSPERFSQLIAQSHLVISIPTSDSTPVTLLEAMAAGSLPVLSDLPAYHEWIQDAQNGLYTRIDPEQLAAVLRRGIDQPDLRNMAAIINRRLIQERAIWEEQFQVMLQYYQKVFEVSCI
jgi:glycosyltransferase involved in cell wall biosynthesis